MINTKINQELIIVKSSLHIPLIIILVTEYINPIKTYKSIVHIYHKNRKVTQDKKSIKNHTDPIQVFPKDLAQIPKQILCIHFLK